MHQLAQYIAHVDTDATRGGLTVVILFLVIHGVVKLSLVYALLRRILWAYPYALGVLVLFLVYQLYVCIVQPSVSMVLFALLDAIIVWWYGANGANWLAKPSSACYTMLMIILHIAIAVLSLIFAAIALIRPSLGQIKIVGATTVATLASGAVLIAQGANILHMCVSGLLFTSLTVAAMSISLRAVRRQQLAVHVR